MQTASGGTDRDTARHGAVAPIDDGHLAVALAIAGVALWVLGCAALAAGGHYLLSFLASAALLGGVAALAIYRSPAGAARRPMRPTDWSTYDRRHSGARRRRVRGLGRAVTLGRAALRHARRVLHRHGAGLPYPVSMPPGAQGPRPALRQRRDGARRRR